MEDMDETRDYSAQPDDGEVIEVDIEGNEQDQDRWIMQYKP